jgi:hypothetical protein
MKQSLVRLLADEAAPFLAAYRYIGWGYVSGRRGRRTWRVQCLEDAAENVGQIPVPPKYVGKTPEKLTVWRPEHPARVRQARSTA